MKTLLQPDHLVLVPENDEERAALASWRAAHDGFAFAMLPNAGSGVSLAALGRREEACREPINVTSDSPHPIGLIANFAPTPFELDGMAYACVEAFWQSLRFPDAERPRIAKLDGAAAKRESSQQPYGQSVVYGGDTIAVGTYEHWALMQRACRAKFEQNADARAALLATGERPLIHRVRRDSRTIPGVIMADIWMRLRARLRRASAVEAAGGTPPLASLPRLQ
jgi:predicted NAD-dependent protein-ADP-ribosyltransferase YbiA (DUF1768 family)